MNEDTKMDKEALKIHVDETSSDEEGHSSFDEIYYKLKPPPQHIDKSQFSIIEASAPSSVTLIDKNIDIRTGNRFLALRQQDTGEESNSSEDEEVRETTNGIFASSREDVDEAGNRFLALRQEDTDEEINISEDETTNIIIPAFSQEDDVVKKIKRSELSYITKDEETFNVIKSKRKRRKRMRNRKKTVNPNSDSRRTTDGGLKDNDPRQNTFDWSTGPSYNEIGDTFHQSQFLEYVSSYSSAGLEEKYFGILPHNEVYFSSDESDFGSIWHQNELPYLTDTEKVAKMFKDNYPRQNTFDWSSGPSYNEIEGTFHNGQSLEYVSNYYSAILEEKCFEILPQNEVYEYDLRSDWHQNGLLYEEYPSDETPTAEKTSSNLFKKVCTFKNILTLGVIAGIFLLMRRVTISGYMRNNNLKMLKVIPIHRKVGSMEVHMRHFFKLINVKLKVLQLKIR